MSEEYVPLAELIDTLGVLHNECYTGMIFVTTDDERSAQISLFEGSIVSLFFRNLRDEEALPLLGEIQRCRFRIAKMPVKRGHAALPPTPHILQFLSAESAVTSGTAPAPSAGTHSDLSEPIKTTLQAELTRFLGPIAALVCAEHLAAVSDVTSAITALAHEIPDATEAEEFTRNVEKKLS